MKMVKMLVLLLIACAMIVSDKVADRLRPAERYPDMGDVSDAMQFIEKGKDVPSCIHFPIYMSRFDLKKVKVDDDYQSQLPVNVYLGETAVLITDSENGYRWLTNGYGTRYRVW